jgi:hypothetical protein
MTQRRVGVVKGLKFGTSPAMMLSDTGPACLPLEQRPRKSIVPAGAILEVECERMDLSDE